MECISNVLAFLFASACQRGKTPEWYNKSYGHICSHNMTKIRNALRKRQQEREAAAKKSADH